MMQLRHCAIAAAAVMLAACSADPTAPRSSLSDVALTRDIAGDVVGAVTVDLDLMHGAELAAGIPMTGAPRAGTPLCPYSPTAGRFVCPPTTLDGLTLERSYAIWAGNVPQPAYDPVTTDSMNFQSRLTGRLEHGASTAALHDMRSLTVSGLAGAETSRTWNGLGARTDTISVSGDGPARRTTVTSLDRIDGLVYRLPRAVYPYPQSGAITHDLVATSERADGSPGDGRSVSRHVVITFDGTATAHVLVGVTACTIDLAARTTTCGR